MPFQKGNQLGKKNKGRIHTKDEIVKMKLAAKLKDKSIYQDPERNKKISESRLGEKHPLWAGNNVTKSQLHQWVRRHKPKKDLCENCNIVPPLDLANISQDYKRDINDFKWLCRSCHMREDGRLELLQLNSKKRRSQNFSTL